jgi:hypothetical protein
MYRVYACFALQKRLMKKRRESGNAGKAAKHSVKPGAAAKASPDAGEHPPPPRTRWAFYENGTGARAAALHDLMRLLHVNAQS